MQKYMARNLLKYSTEQLWDILTGPFILEFDDGELETNAKDVLYSSYMWDLNREFINAPFLKSHCVTSILNNSSLSPSTHIAILNRILWDIFDSSNEVDKFNLLDHLCKKIYVISGNIYNDLSYRLEEYLTSLDIKDFIQISNLVEEDIAVAEPTPHGIEGVYNKLREIFKRPEYNNNPLIKAINSSVVRTSQVLQCLGVRGKITDIDSWEFPEPVMKGFVHGLYDLYSATIETRSAAKALAYSKEEVANSEFSSRKQQLISQNLKYIHAGDCGSKCYIDWQVRDSRYDNEEYELDEEEAKIVKNRYKSDLLTIAGKYYLDETTNTLKVVKVSDTHLLGKNIKMRDPVAGCNHPDPNGVCLTCFGEAGLAINRKIGLGQNCVTVLYGTISQLILSTKHELASSVVEGIILRPDEKNYLATKKANDDTYYLNEKLSNKKLKITVSSDTVKNLSDIIEYDLTNITNSRIGYIKEMLLTIHDSKDKFIDEVALNLSINDRHALFTREFLEYIKIHGWDVDKSKNKNFVFDMKDWNFKKPIFTLPMKHFNMTAVQKDISKMLMSTIKDMKHRASNINPSVFLIELHDLINRRCDMNLSVISGIVYSILAINPIQHNYNLPKVGDTFMLGVEQKLLAYRSLSGAMGYQGHDRRFIEPVQYILDQRMDHPCDPLIMPEILN